jgi:very-short-patch-repair endonuclease
MMSASDSASPIQSILTATTDKRAGVIEVDGPHHGKPGRASSDSSRDSLMINAGVEWVSRLDVRDVHSKAEVEKFVDTFLARLARR